MRFFLELAYDGKTYHGWQKQENATSVQEILEEKLSILLKEKTETIGCGRTDTGVHAAQFYVHFDSESLPYKSTVFVHKLNALLPYDISILRIFKTDTQNHARFSAIERTYHYHVHSHKNPFIRNYSVLVNRNLNIDLMNKGASLLLNHTDFTSFCKLHGGNKTNTCKVIRAEWIKTGDGYCFIITADRFLRNMVRSIVGTLLKVGEEKLTIKAFEKIILAKDRKSAGESAPAHGLFLQEIKYPFTL